MTAKILLRININHLLLLMVIFLFFLFFQTDNAYAYDPQNGDITVTVQDELGNSVSGATLSLMCSSAGAPTNHSDGGGTDSEATAGVITIAAASTGCTNGDSYNVIRVFKSGYVGYDVTPNPTTYTTASVNDGGTSANKFGVRVNVGDELGNALSGATLSLGGSAPSDESSNSYYFVASGPATSLTVALSGYIGVSSSTDSQLAGVTPPANPSSAAQTIVNLAGTTACNTGSTVTGSVTTTCSGLKFALKSVVLQSEIGGDITDILDGVSSANVSVSGTGGTTIVGYSVDSNVVYIAATGNGAGNDQVIVQFQDVTVDGGIADGADLVKATLTDSGNLIFNDGNPLTSQTTFDIGSGGSADITTTGAKYPLYVNVGDELGNTINITELTTTTYNGESAYYSSGNVVYFANTASNQAVLVNKDGFLDGESVNAGLNDVSTNQDDQTIIQMGDNGPRAAAISAGSTVSIRGLKYVLISTLLESELGGAITDLATGSEFTGSGTPSDDVTITGSGITIRASAVTNDTIYIAATGTGGGDDSVTVQVQNVTTADGAEIFADFVKYVKSTITDSTNLIAAGTAQNDFEIGPNANTTLLNTTGFKYPVKVTVADELDNPIDVADLTSIVWAANQPITAANNVAYFGNLGDGGMLIAKTGFLGAGRTTSGDQEAQTDITLGSVNDNDDDISAGDTINITGLTYKIKSSLLRSELGESITAMANGLETTGTGTPSADVTIVAGAGITLYGSAVDNDTIYIALTADGSGNGADAFTVQVQNVTAGIGLANGADLVKASFSDSTDQISGASAQITFDIGSGGVGTLITPGFEYPLKVVLANEIGGEELPDEIATLTYNVNSAYTDVNDTAYYANTASNATLNIAKAGYRNATTTNTGLLDVSTDQAAQTTITLGEYAASAGAVTAGSSVTIKGLEFGQKITVTREQDDEALNGATVTAGSSPTTCTEDGATGIYYCAVPVAEDGGTNDISVVKSGYVTKQGDTGNRTDGTSAQSSTTISDVLFQLKVTLSDELGNEVDISTLSTATYNGEGAYYYSGNVVYFANTATRGTLTLSKDGFVDSEVTNTSLANSDTTGITTSAAGQIAITMGSGIAANNAAIITTDANAKGLEYGYKITGIADELENELDTVAVITGNSYGTSCTEESGAWYCPIPLANTSIQIKTVKDGYVTDTATSFDNDRTANSDAQQTTDVTGVLFSHKIIAEREGDAGSLTGATTGIDATDCEEDGATGIYYCAVLLTDDDDATISVAKTGYVTYTTSATDRTAATDAQAEYTSENLFTLKITILDGDNAALTGATATVTSGENSTTTPDITSSNIQYFALDPADYDPAGVSVAKTGYDSDSETNQSISASAQQDITVNLTAVVAEENNAGSGGGGGSGGSSTSDLPKTVSTTPSTQQQTFNSPIDLPTSGMIVRPTLVENGSKTASVLIPKDTLVTTTAGEAYDGTITPPSIIAPTKLPAPLPAGQSFAQAIVIKTSGELKFNKAITITIPLTSQAKPGIKVYFYNESSKQYELAGDGGQLAADGKSISVMVDHLTTFVVTEPQKETEEKQAGPFTDTEGHWAVEDIQKLYELGVIKGRTTTTFEPNSYLTRAEIVKVALLTFGYNLELKPQSSFQDLDGTAWYGSLIDIAKEEGLVSGYPDGTFRPNSYVNRAEALKILLTAAKLKVDGATKADFSDVEQSGWYAPFVNFAFENGVVKGKSTGIFAPNDSVTRGEMAKIAIKILELK